MTHEATLMDNAQVKQIQAQMTQPPADYNTAHQHFLKRYPHYQNTTKIDTLRAEEYQRLDAQGQIYLDYTGGGIYASGQVQQHMAMLMNGVYGNPHSANPTSMAMTRLDDQARQYVYEFFNADPEEYVIIFTANASGALRLVGESYPFEDNGQFLLTFDNHNSVNGIREFAKRSSAKITYSPVIPPDLRIDDQRLMQSLEQAIPGGNNLFAYPAQSNFSGVQHSLEWIEIAQKKGWDVLVDCAAFTPTNRLDLSQWKPDFISLSFYKIFGYPTGIGALIARRSCLRKLHRPWFAGGTISMVSVQVDAHFLHDDETGFEDGTIDYLNLPAVEIGLKHINSVGIDLIHERVMTLAAYVLEELTHMRHDNGQALIKIYGPVTTEARGGTIAMNFYDPDRLIFDFRLIEALANEANISLRTGCFCNPGAGELAHNISEAEVRNCLRDSERMTFEEYVVAMTAQGHEQEGVGAVRVSMGLASNFNDVYQFVRFARSLLNVKSPGLQF